VRLLQSLLQQPGGRGKARCRNQGRRGKAVAIQANVADPASIAPLVDAVATQLGPIDILVNNAGIYELAPWMP